jgi:hypothetical protein
MNNSDYYNKLKKIKKLKKKEKHRVVWGDEVIEPPLNHLLGWPNPNNHPLFFVIFVDMI